MSLLWREKGNKCKTSWARSECESSNVRTSGLMQIPNRPLKCVEHDLVLPSRFQVHVHVVTCTWVPTLILHWYLLGGRTSFLVTRWCDIQLVEILGNQTFDKKLTQHTRIPRDEEVHNIDHFGFVKLASLRTLVTGWESECFIQMMFVSIYTHYQVNNNMYFLFTLKVYYSHYSTIYTFNEYITIFV